MRQRGRLPGNPSLPVRRHGGGYFAEGPGFYIWDEDPGAVLRGARELQGGFLRAGSGTRPRVARLPERAPRPGQEG